jgi:hypothetical protein
MNLVISYCSVNEQNPQICFAVAGMRHNMLVARLAICLFASEACYLFVCERGLLFVCFPVAGMRHNMLAARLAICL